VLPGSFRSTPESQPQPGPLPQRAVLLGGTSEIGLAVLRKLVEGRCHLRHIVLAGRDEQVLRAPADELLALGAQNVYFERFDATDTASHLDLARRCADRLGGIDVVILSAGVLGDQARLEVDPVAAREVMDVNFSGSASALLAFSQALAAQGHGRLVVMSSVAGMRARRANFVYGASKAGLDAFAQGLADALFGTGVSVTIVRPGFVRTRMTAGRHVPPLSTRPDQVADAVVTGISCGASVVYSPGVFRPLSALFRLLPRSLWRRLPL
jgi:decaprenylphospho-beta-D-erythro-pentofuranosid-2-ulose 2-reductase